MIALDSTSPYVDDMEIAFKFAADKAAAAIQMLVQRNPGVDLHTALKSFYFADKSHLNAEGRPIFGARYRAMKYGPVPLEIYEMIKGESYWLAELGEEKYPWKIEGFLLHPGPDNGPQFSNEVFSPSDLEHLEAGMELSRSMTFNHRTAATHGLDWRAANMGIMRYEDMIEDTPQKEAILRYLIENSMHVRL